MFEMNGKEMLHASFNKWTSKKFLDDLRIKKVKVLEDFIEKTSERSHRFWQRDPLALLLNSKQKMEQKLEYLHLNPLHERGILQLHLKIINGTPPIFITPVLMIGDFNTLLGEILIYT